MLTQSNQKEELLSKIDKLSSLEIEKVKIFIAGVEAGKNTPTPPTNKAG